MTVTRFDEIAILRTAIRQFGPTSSCGELLKSTRKCLEESLALVEPDDKAFSLSDDVETACDRFVRANAPLLTRKEEAEPLRLAAMNACDALEEHLKTLPPSPRARILHRT